MCLVALRLLIKWNVFENLCTTSSGCKINSQASMTANLILVLPDEAVTVRSITRRVD